MLSGGDSVVANEMRQADRGWTPSHTLVFTFNTAPGLRRRPGRHAPSVRATAHRAYTPWMRAKFRRTARVKSAEVILAWCIEGTRLWLDEDAGGVIALPSSVIDLPRRPH